MIEKFESPSTWGQGGHDRKVSGVHCRAIKEKRTFFGTFFSDNPKFQRPLSSRGGGGLGINGPAIKRRIFFAASLKQAS